MKQQESVTEVSTSPVKAIDLEHHFFVPEFIDFVKARKEYPNWKEGLGVCYPKNRLIASFKR